VSVWCGQQEREEKEKRSAEAVLFRFFLLFKEE